MGYSNGIYKKKKLRKSVYAQIFLQDWKLHSRNTTIHSPTQKRFLMNKMKGKVFSKIDLNEASLQIPVEKNSSKLLCINTHRGLYTFDRLVFGIKVSPAISVQVRDTMLGGFDFTFAYLDDIVISSKTK